MRKVNGKESPLVQVRESGIHGTGVFALRRIAKGTRIIEYVGERVSHAEADRRYEDKDVMDNHTFLFIVDGRTVVDETARRRDAWVESALDELSDEELETLERAAAIMERMAAR